MAKKVWWLSEDGFIQGFVYQISYYNNGPLHYCLTTSKGFYQIPSMPVRLEAEIFTTIGDLKRYYTKKSKTP